MALEPRLVFDAAVGATFEQAAAQVAEQQADAAVDSGSFGDVRDNVPAAQGELIEFGAEGSDDVEIAFVDASVENIDQLLVGIDPSIEIIMLDSTEDGVEQIADALRDREEVAAIHILSHGDQGELHLGNTVLDANSMQGEHLADLQIMRDSLSADGDILIYGCDFTGGESGLEAAILLGLITSADIAASVDGTGHADLGGNWILETEVGEVEAEAVSAESWNGLLAPGVATLDWTTQPDHTMGATTTYSVGGLTDAISVTTTGTGSITNDETGNFTGGTGDETLVLRPNSTSTTVGQTTEIVFNSSAYTDGVQTVAFDIRNIDSNSGSWDDRIVIEAYDTNGVKLSGADFIATPREPVGVTYSITSLADGLQLDGDSYYASFDLPEDSVGIAITSTTGANIGRVSILHTSGTSGTNTGAAGISDITVTYDLPPTLDLDTTDTASPVVIASDNFESGGFAGGTGWTGSWTTSFSGGGNASDVGVASDGGDNSLFIDDDGVSIQRSADLSGETTATLSFDYRRSGLDNNSAEYITIEVASSSAGPFTEIGRFEGPATDAAYLNFSADISAFISSDTTIRFVTSSGLDNNDRLYIDDLSIVASGPEPTGYATSTVANAGPVSIASPDVGVADGTDTNMASATITLTNAQIGDALSVTGTLPGGISASINPGNDTITLTGTASIADYESAIEAIGFATTGSDTTDRTIVVQVSDGINASNVATSTVTITAPSATGWGVTGDVSVTEGGSANYVISLSDTIAAGQSASVDLSLTDVDTTSADYNDFVAAVNAAVASRSELTFDGTTLTYTAPSSYDETWNSSGSSYADISGTGVDLNQSDDDSDQVSLGFNFEFFGSSYSEVYVGSNGTITFGGGSSVYSNQDLSAGGVSGLPSIAAFWDDLNPSASPGDVFYELGTDGSGNNTITVQWNNLVHYGGANPVSLQVVLTENTNTIEISYADTDFANASWDDGASATVGIHDGNSTFIQYSAPATANVTAGGSLTYAPPSTTMAPLTVTLGTVDDADVEGNEDFRLQLSNAVNSGITADISVDTTIIDNDFANTPPVANPNLVSGAEDTQITGDIEADDTDVDGDALTVTQFEVGGNTVTVAPVTGGSIGLTEGDLTIFADGSFTFDPVADWNGVVPQITYTISDGTDSDTSTLDITVNPVDDAEDDSFTVNEDTTLSDTVAGNDSFAGPASYAVGSGPSNGSLILNPDGSFSYTPSADYNGSDSFTYVVSDQHGNTETQTVTITVDAVNDAPVASVTPETTAEDTAVSGSITMSDVDGDTLIATLDSGASNGSVTVNPDGSYTYTPSADFNGSDSFDILVSDGNGGSTIVTVPVTVTAVDDAEDDSFTVNEDTTLSDTVAGNDSFAGPASYAVGSGPSNGSLILNPDGSFSYTPSADYNGSDSFTYVVSDQHGNTETQTVTITVDAVNDAPVASVTPETTAEDTAVSGSITMSDVDGDTLIATLDSGASNGSVTVNPDGSYTYTPSADFNGSDSFDILVSDGNGGSTIVTVPVTVTAVDDAEDDSFTVNEDTTLSDTVAGNDSFAGPASYAVGSGPSNGSLILNPDGSFSYTPSADYNGSDSFTYVVSDQHGNTETQTVTITVDAVNDAPVASVTPETTAEDTAVSGSITMSDVDGDTLIATLDSGASNGSVTVNPDGSYTYTPSADFNGSDSFDILVSDGNGGSTIVTVPVTVTAVDDAEDDSFTVNEDTTLSDTVAGNDSFAGPASYAVGSGPSNGSLILNPDGSFSYTPSADYNGSDSFTYVVSDQHGNTETQTVTITVDAVNDAPVASVTPETTAEDTAVSGSITMSDVDGDTLIATLDSGASNGSVTVNPDGSYTYTPSADFNGSDSFDILVSDGNGGSTIVTVPVTVTAVDDAEDDSFTVNEDTTLSDTVAGNDSFAGPASYAVGSGPSNGSLILNPDGSFSYTPSADYNGSDSFTYVVSDQHGNTETQTVTITVDAVNDAPVASVTPETTAEDTAVSGSITMSDVDGDTLIATLDSGASNGSVTVNPDGSYTYTPSADFNGSDSFDILVSDGNGGSTIVTVPVTVTAVDDAEDDSFTVNEDTTLSDTVAGNDSFAGPASYAVGSGPSNGSLILNPDGSFSYTPSADYNGSDSFTYVVSDQHGNTETQTVTITVDAVNDAPVASVTPETTAEDTAVSGSITMSDVDGDTLIATLDSGASNGSVTVNPDGSYTYTPSADFNGSDSFDILVSDGNGGSTIVTVPVTVTAVDDAEDDSFTVNEDTTLSDTVAGNDSFAGPASYAVGSGPSNGSLILNPDGSFSYTPSADYNGSDSFTYVVSDQHGNTETQTVTITVDAVNDAPVASVTPETTAEDTAVSGSITMSDVDGDTLIATLDSGASNGSVTVNPDGSYTYTPSADFNGSDSFDILVSDGNGGSTIVTVPVTVTAVDDAEDDSFTVNEDTTLSDTVAGNDSFAGPASYAVGSGPSNGSLILNPDGSFSYTPSADYNGSDSFTYVVSDQHGNTETQTVTITVDAVNDAPVASVTPETTAEDTAVSGSITMSDVDGDTLIATLDSGASNGSVTVNPDGSYTYTPSADFNGSDSFDILVSDGNGGSTIVTVPVTVTAVDDAEDDSFTVNEDTTLSDTVAGNDSFAGPASYAVGSGPSNGSLILNPDGSFSYTPSADYNGSDSFTYVVSDQHGNTETQTVTITVDAVNDAPVASVTPETTAEDTAVSGSITMSDVDGDTLIATLDSGASNGSVTVNPDGSYTYTPSADFNGSDSFDILVSDGNGGSTIVTVPVTVTAVDDAEDDSFTVNEDTTLSDTVAGNDSFAGPASYAVGSGPSNGSLILNPDGSFSYTPSADYNGSDSFTYVVSDQHGNTETQTVTITVDAVNDAPVASVTPETTAEDTAVSGSITMSDVDGDTLIATLDSGASNGSVTVNPDGSYTYTPSADFNGSDSFDILVSDGNGGSTIVTVPVTVTAVDDAEDDSFTVNEFEQLLPLQETYRELSSYETEMLLNDARNGVVLETVRSFGDVGKRLVDLEANGVVLNTVNAITDLGGIQKQPVGVSNAGTLISDTGELNRLTQIFNREFGTSFASWHAEVLTGYSLRMDVDDIASIKDPEKNGQIFVNTLIRDHVVYIELGNTLALEEERAIANYKIWLADGRALPPWVRQADQQLLLVEPPADRSELELKIVAVHNDGELTTKEIKLQLTTGELKQLDVSDARKIQTFGEQLQAVDEDPIGQIRRAGELAGQHLSGGANAK